VFPRFPHIPCLAALHYTADVHNKLFLLAGLGAAAWGQAPASFRPPAIPLVAHDPYFSIWSMNDRLAGEGTKHWTGKPNSLTALVRIDGKTYRLMGADPRRIPPLEQRSVEVLPTRTIYEFAAPGMTIGLTFFTPALPDDLEVLSRPLTYIEFRAAAAGGAHQVAFYLEAGADLVVNTPDEAVVASRYRIGALPALRMGSQEQPVLAKRGDDLRIDWGYLYLAADRNEGVTEVIEGRDAARSAFESGGLGATDDALDGQGNRLSLAYDIHLENVGTSPVTRYLMLAYDDLYSIEYFQRRERAWWRRKGAEAGDLIRAARREHDALLARSEKFDEELMADMRKIGGERYARLAALAYRQTLAAHKLVADIDGTAMYFPKENFSNGCISTVDVIYPSAPFTLLFNPQLLKAQLQPVLDYARLDRWHWPFAPHDLGRYPQANGQVYGGGELTEQNQMPVEESGNMLILLAALAHVEGNAAFSEKYWPQVTKWANYLKEKGLDPENQLSTDDFAGHLAHNANLSIKAIVALGAYGELCERTGRAKEAALYRSTAREFARKWIDLAKEGDHYRLAFDKPGTWSQKYNLVWDKLLGLNLFPAEVARQEMAFYLTRQNRYGLPLDNRRDYTKLDWILWTATLADSPGDFEKLVAPVYDFGNESPSRVPLTDWFDTVTGKQQGFQARSVVGGVFIKMLADPAVWQKYAARAASGATGNSQFCLICSNN
jgi:glutaminase A-like protein/uncharacterized protein DUF5127/uncharacterized protein DUF4964